MTNSTLNSLARAVYAKPAASSAGAAPVAPAATAGLPPSPADAANNQSPSAGGFRVGEASDSLPESARQKFLALRDEASELHELLRISTDAKIEAGNSLYQAEAELKRVKFGYTAFLKDEKRGKSQADANAELTRKKTEMLEIRIAKEIGELIDMATAEQVLAEVCAATVMEWTNFPTLVRFETKSEQAAQIVERLCDEARHRVADSLTAAIEKLGMSEEEREALDAGDDDPQDDPPASAKTARAPGRRKAG